MFISLSAQKKRTKEMRPKKPLLKEFVRSFEKFGSRLNSLRFTPLRQNPLLPRIFLHSLTGFKGILESVDGLLCWGLCLFGLGYNSTSFGGGLNMENI